MSRLHGIVVLTVGAALLLNSCGSATKVLRYRLTVEVETPRGAATGSAVLETRFNSGNRFEYSASTATLGEGPVVDLGGGRYLFSALSDPFFKKDMYFILLRVLRDPQTRPSLDPSRSVFDQALKSRPVGLVKPEDYPLLVAFDDPRRPETVRIVDPENLSTQFGPGYRVHSVSIQVVDANEPLTKGLYTRFPEITKPGRSFRPTVISSEGFQDVAGRLQYDYFVRR